MIFLLQFSWDVRYGLMTIVFLAADLTFMLFDPFGLVETNLKLYAGLMLVFTILAGLCWWRNKYLEERRGIYKEK